MQPQWQIWFLAIRPKTLILSFCPVLIGTFLAFKEHTFHGLTFLFTLLTALGIQIAANLANDYFDFVKGADTARAQRADARHTVWADEPLQHPQSDAPRFCADGGLWILFDLGGRRRIAFLVFYR